MFVGAFALAGVTLDAFAAEAPVIARGASNVSGRLDLTSKGETLVLAGSLKSLNPGTYEVVLMPACPPEPRPTDLKSGRVREDLRSGRERKKIEGRRASAGTFIANDREKATFEMTLSRSQLTGWSRMSVGLLEGDDVNPPLSDPFGLVACTPFASPGAP